MIDYWNYRSFFMVLESRVVYSALIDEGISKCILIEMVNEAKVKTHQHSWEMMFVLDGNRPTGADDQIYQAPRFSRGPMGVAS